MKFKHRHRLRRKEVAKLVDTLSSNMGVVPFDEDTALDRASAADFDVLFIKSTVVGLVFDDVPYLSIRGILKYGAKKGYLTVDMGAVPYVINGADIMAPGITDGDLALKKDSLAWVRDENNSQPLAIVRLLKDMEEILNERKGKAATNLHYVGDKLWTSEA